LENKQKPYHMPAYYNEFKPEAAHMLNRGEHSAVPAEFMKWVWAGGRKQKGLVRRREAEAGIYE